MHIYGIDERRLSYIYTRILISSCELQYNKNTLLVRQIDSQMNICSSQIEIEINRQKDRDRKLQTIFKQTFSEADLKNHFLSKKNCRPRRLFYYTVQHI